MSFVLDLTRGQARVRQVVFNRGQPRPTVSIGRAAAWSLVADDLEDVHAFVSFDGAALMVRSAEANNPAWLDGRAVPCAWTPVGRASILALGNARITVTAQADHVRPGMDDEEVTGQMELRPAAPAPPGNGAANLSTITGATGVTAISALEPATDPDGFPGDGFSTGGAVTGDEPTGEMTGARAPSRGLLPRPRMPPRPSAPSAPLRAAPPVSMPVSRPEPPTLEVPDFDDPTELRPRAELVPAARRHLADAAAGAAPAPRPPARDDDEERTQALDVAALEQRQRSASRPARPNIAIAPDSDEATRMLALARPAAPGARGRETVQVQGDPRLAGAPAFVATLPSPVAPPPPPPLAHLRAGDEPFDDASRPDTAPPPSGATQLRPMTAPAFRPPGITAPARPRAETLIDPLAATGGNLRAARLEALQSPQPLQLQPLASLPALPPIPPGPLPTSVDATGPVRSLGSQGHPTVATKRASRWASPSTIISGVTTVTALGLYIAYAAFGVGRPHPAAPPAGARAGGGALTSTPAAAATGGSVPVVSAADADAGAGALIGQNRNTLPLPELPHKGVVDAGAPALDPGLDGGVTTMQRAAVDAIAEGDLARATLYYNQLAELAPNVSAYSAAARILKAQMAADAGGRRF